MSVHECRSGFKDLSSASSSSSSSSSSKPCKDRWMGVDRALISLAVTRAWAQQRAADAVLNDRAGGESGNTNVGHGCRSGAVVEGVRTGWLCILTSRLTAHGAPLIHWLTLGARRLLTGRRGTLAAVPRYYALRLARRIVCWKRGRGRSPEQRDKESQTHGDRNSCAIYLFWKR